MLRMDCTSSKFQLSTSFNINRHPFAWLFNNCQMRNYGTKEWDTLVFKGYTNFPSIKVMNRCPTYQFLLKVTMSTCLGNNTKKLCQRKTWFKLQDKTSFFTLIYVDHSNTLGCEDQSTFLLSHMIFQEICGYSSYFKNLKLLKSSKHWLNSLIGAKESTSSHFIAIGVEISFQQHSTSFWKLKESNDSSPQQNNVAKQKNWTILNHAKSKIVFVQLPNYLWIKVINIVVYLTNHSPTSVNGGLIPKQVYTCKPPQLGHLKVFGCLTYIYIFREKSGKLGLRAEQKIFVDYDDVSKAYQIYNLQIQKIVVTKDVIFNESFVGFRMLQ